MNTKVKKEITDEMALEMVIAITNGEDKYEVCKRYGVSFVAFGQKLLADFKKDNPDLEKESISDPKAEDK